MENEKEGFPITALREIKLLKRLNNDNVICLKEIVRSQGREMTDHVSRCILHLSRLWVHVVEITSTMSAPSVLLHV